MSDFLIFVIIIAAWFFLQGWLLPRMGVSTCVKPACPVEDGKKGKTPPESEGDQ